ncbi:MAG: LysR family transcriptional regulator [Novibacillus thermophilus]|uniref:LysR family transcriptional regulator n=1 Tax=Novibacillus thermophilus TaxID=1471761 RepID=A0A1U9K701_9BACL|nr:LysR family transcriptional regulator [Novibacillus thermophilus]AQS55802.1 LysR family transcriptional regulator [Novibacillus thermophilus]
MELRHLMTFKTIIDAGGFKKAADELGYAQSSITAHIKELEQELGYPLFDRLGKSIALTQAGRRFLPYALDMINLYSKSKEVMKEANEPSGELKIGASESLMVYWLPSVIMDFMKHYPKVELRIKTIDYDNLSNQLKKGDIDAAVLVETSSWKSKELTIQKIRDEKLSMIQSPHKTNHFASDTMLVTEYSCSWRPIMEYYLKKEGRTSVPRIELPSVEAIKKCVLCGLGRSMLPHFSVKDEIDKGELKAIKTDLEETPIAIYTAFHKDKWVSVNLEAFLNVLHNHKEV